MQAAAIPVEEDHRIQVLQDLNILDTQPSPDFDDLTTLAAHFFATKFALVSLVDSNRTWYKAKYGLNVCESPRTNAFCAHAILGAGVFVVMDARRDARFADNATVAGSPHLRFYACAPIVIDDAAIGTLCLLDDEPRERFDEENRGHLERFAKVAASCAIKRRIIPDCPI
jgi:GAF domain-containing protein